MLRGLLFRFGLLFVMLSFAPGGRSQTGSGANLDVVSLRGARALVVVVEELRPSSVQAGLSKAWLKKAVTDWLEAGGVRVLPETRLSELPGWEHLYINVNATSPQASAGEFFVFNVDVALKQSVALTRDKQIETIATTWEQGSVGPATRSNLSARVGAVVKGYVDKFLRDWRTVNK